MNKTLFNIVAITIGSVIYPLGVAAQVVVDQTALRFLDGTCQFEETEVVCGWDGGERVERYPF